MEQNHDALKAALTQRLQKFGKWAVRITWFAIIWELLRLACNIPRFHMSSSVSAESFSLLDYLKAVSMRELWTKYLPAVILLIAVLLLTIRLYRSIRKEGIPFSRQTVKLLRICGTLMGIRAALPLISNLNVLIMGGIGGVSSYFNNIIIEVFERDFSVWICMMLFLCAEIANYGAALQQESDETL